MKIHPVAELFPLLEGAAFDQLVESIRTNGLIETIKTWRGILIDGRNRKAACGPAGVEPRFEAMDDKLADEFAVIRYIIAQNIDRRHLTPGQIAMLGVTLRPQYEAAAKARQEAGRKKGAASTAAKARGTDEGLSPEKRAKPSREGRVDHQIAAALGVGHDTIAKAHRLAQEAPELFAKVSSNEITLNAAHRMHIERVRSQRAPEPAPVEREVSAEARKAEAAAEDSDTGLLVWREVFLPSNRERGREPHRL